MASMQISYTDHRALSNGPSLPILPVWLSQIAMTTRATAPEPRIYQNPGFSLPAIIKPIATSNPRQEQIKPPREPVRSKAKKQVNPAAERRMTLNARCSFDRISSNSLIEENRSDCSDSHAEQNHRITPAPTNVAAVLWLTKVAVRFPR